MIDWNYIFKFLYESRGIIAIITVYLGGRKSRFQLLIKRSQIGCGVRASDILFYKKKKLYVGELNPKC